MPFESLLIVVLFSLGGGLFLLERIPSFQRQWTSLNGRLTTNLGLMLIGGILVGLLFPTSPYTAATQSSGWIHSLDLSTGIQAFLVFFFMDVWRYWEHRIFHKASFLWRFHLVHHSDTAIDVTTAERHHPVETLITTPLVLMLVLVLGLPAAGIAAYLLAAMISALWVHSNLKFPEEIDSVLRILIVTPAVHAIHHSNKRQETDSNYGAVFTLWDRLFGTYTDPVNTHIQHFGLEYFHYPEDSTLTRTLLQPVLYRTGMSYPVRKVQPEKTASQTITTAIGIEWQQALLYGSLGIAITCLAMWPTFLNLTTVWSTSEPYQYAWLVLPFLIYVLGWHYRSEILSMSPRADLLGFVIVTIAVGLWLAATIVQIDLVMYIAFILALQGILISMLGRHIWWRFFPIFGILFFMIPSGDILQLPLKLLTVEIIDWFANTTNLPHSIDGFVIYIGAHRYVVIDACSGLTFVTLSAFLCYCWGSLLYQSFSKVAGFALLGGILGIAANAIRVNMIVWLDWINDTEMNLTEHGDIQLIALVFLLGALFLVVGQLQPDSKSNRQQLSEKKLITAAPWKKYIPVITGLFIVATVGPIQFLMTTSQPKLFLAKNEQLPGNFTTSSVNLSQTRWVINEESRTSSLNLALDQTLDALIVQALPGNKKLPESWLIPKEEGGDWRKANIQKQLVCFQEKQCINFVHTTWNKHGSNDVRHVFYVYHVGDFFTDSKFLYRMAAGWNRLRGFNQKAGFISFFSTESRTSSQQLADAYAQIKTKI